MIKAVLQDKRARERALAGIDRYAQAENSDPFAARRAYAHMRQGIIEDGDYDAEVVHETRAINSVEFGRHIEYKVPAYRNVKRA